MEYVVPENIQTPSPWNVRNFLTWLGTPRKLIVTSKILFPYTIMRKLIVCDKEAEKIIFFMLVQCLIYSQFCLLKVFFN